MQILRCFPFHFPWSALRPSRECSAFNPYGYSQLTWLVVPTSAAWDYNPQFAALMLLRVCLVLVLVACSAPLGRCQGDQQGEEPGLPITMNGDVIDSGE